jgi:hypothetical protein
VNCAVILHALARHLEEMKKRFCDFSCIFQETVVALNT